MRSAYQPRIADAELRRRLASSGAVVIEGPKACGKTATARQAAASEVLLDVDAAARQAAAVAPELALAGKAPRLIDEWQVEPALWNAVRRAVDDADAPGGFILTGSAAPADDITRHSGAGRISRLRMRTMTLAELGFSSAEISLAGLLSGAAPEAAPTAHSVPELVVQLCRGGWPGERHLSDPACLRARIDYLEEIRRTDISRPDGVRRDPNNVGRVLRSLARHVATPVSAAALAADARGDSAAPLRDATARGYLEALERLMVYEEQTAWAAHLRSRSSLRQAPKRHFADPSLAVAALGATPDRLLGDLESLGFLFESLAYHELAAYAAACDAAVHHYRDNTGLEVDAIVQARHGDWCAFEVKLGGGQIDAAAATLLKFRERVELDRSGAPGALGVIVATGYGYRRPDGVAVIPIGALGP